MCVAIVKPPNVDFPEKLFEAAWRKNPHGGGFMYARDGRVVVEKGFMALKDMMESYKKHEPSFGDSPVVLHFRIKTHGPIAPAQTHPFVVNDRLAFVHNGTISIQIPEGSKNSDTMEFNDRVLKRLPEGFLQDPVTMELIRGYVDPSRLVFLDGQGNISIVNEESGYRDPQGRWHSNDGALAAVDPAYQQSEFYDILETRWDPDISQWGNLSPGSRKAVVGGRKSRRKESRACSGCGRPLASWEDETCEECMTPCNRCGSEVPKALVQYGVDVCPDCMSPEEREGVEEMLEEVGEPMADYGPGSVARAMARAIVRGETGWEDYAAELDNKDFNDFLTHFLKGFTSATEWLRDNSDAALYSELADLLNDSGSLARGVFKQGLEEIERTWGIGRQNPPRGSGKLLVVS